MKERVVFLFLVTMGAIKVYENVGDEDAKDDDDKDDIYSSKKKFKSVGKRSVDEMMDRWNLEEFQEELVEASNGKESTGVIECDRVADDECSCRRLACFGAMSCHRNETKPLSPPSASGLSTNQERLLRCRQTVIWGESLCECKRFVRMGRRRPTRPPLAPDSPKGPGGEGDNRLIHYPRGGVHQPIHGPNPPNPNQLDSPVVMAAEEKVKPKKNGVGRRFDPDRLKAP